MQYDIYCPCSTIIRVECESERFTSWTLYIKGLGSSKIWFVSGNVLSYIFNIHLVLFLIIVASCILPPFLRVIINTWIIIFYEIWKLLKYEQHIFLDALLILWYILCDSIYYACYAVNIAYINNVILFKLYVLIFIYCKYLLLYLVHFFFIVVCI